MLDPGRLRHRVDIEKPIRSRNETTGVAKVIWQVLHTDVPAAIEAVSVRDFIASRAPQSQLVARITIRYRDGLTADMRIIHKARGKIYNPQGWLPDPDSGIEYLTAPCSEGVNTGE